MRHPSKPHANHQAADVLATSDPAATTSAAAAPTETTLATFDGTDGANPIGELVSDGSGDLFGVTYSGGSSNDGTVFEVKASSGQITDLHAFTGTNGDGDLPLASLSTDASGNLYGTTEIGGTKGGGTVFELAALHGGTYAYGTIAQLDTTAGDGSKPASGVYVAPDGTITGTTGAGGANGTGTVFTIAPNSSTPAFTSLPVGSGQYGFGPFTYSAPTKIGTSFYSTTQGDGTTPHPGSIFAFNPQSSTIAAIATFNAATGYQPNSGVVANSAGNLYGTTQEGAGSGYGSIYECNPTTGAIQVLASFNGATGYYPYGNLLRDADGDLFGTTSRGGADGDGTVFELKAGASTIDVLYNFTGGTDGANPQGGLVADKAGNLYGAAQYGGSNGDGTVYEIQNAGFMTVCFAAGTRIRTARGDIAVEALAAGDLVVTASGATRPVRWLGHRTLDCRRHPRPGEARPIRVAAHAFGENRPACDLFLSPGHSVCVDVVGEVLIPVGRLVNGATIKQLDVDTVTYWHVELDSHDIILAENLACESYIDCGTRAFFAESDVVALGASPDAPALTTDDYCRPFKPEGALVDMVRDRLSLRAVDLGWRFIVEDELAGLWLEVDGARIEVVRHGLLARASLPAGTREVRIRSASAVPADLFGDKDERPLGLRLAALVIDDGLGCRREITCTDERLADGFHAHEGTHRWTDGDARLPSELWDGACDLFVLRLAFAGPALPHWVAPAAAVAAAACNAAA